MARKVLREEEAFVRLVKMGCPAALLKGACSQMYAAGTAISNRANTRKRDAVKRKVRAVDAALQKVASRVSSLAKESGTVAMLPELRALVRAIRLWQQGMTRLKGSHEVVFSHARARLIDIVHFYTGEWRDEELSLLVSDACDEVVDRVAQQRWRQRHAGLLRWAMQMRDAEALAPLLSSSQR